jgi:hypothetical protein
VSAVHSAPSKNRARAEIRTCRSTTGQLRPLVNHFTNGRPCPRQALRTFGRVSLWPCAKRLSVHSYCSFSRILPMTSKFAPLGWITKNSPIAAGSRTMLAMLRSWVIITTFEASRCCRMSCKRVHYSIWPDCQIPRPVEADIEQRSRDRTRACRCQCNGNRGW